MKYIQNYLFKISMIIFLLTIALKAETPNFRWVKQFGSSGNENGYRITRDRSGNIYMAGHYDTKFNFENVTLPHLSQREIFIAKLNLDGELLWVKGITGNQDQDLNDIGCDPFGNCIMIGQTSNTIFFDNDSLHCYNWHSDVFVLKFSPQGQVLWSLLGEGDEVATIRGCATDESGNCYITGWGEHIYFKNIHVGYYSGNSGYIFKIDTQGKPQWGKTLNVIYTADISTDGNGNSYVIGYDYGAMKIFKYSPAGDMVWEIPMDDPNYQTYGYSIATDANGNSIITGGFESAIKLGNTNLTSKGKFDMFVAKMDSKGNFLWAKSGGGIGTDKGLGVSMTGSGNVFVTGYMANSATFEQTTLSNPQGTDLFVVCYDKNGTLQWAKNTSGTGETAGESVVSDGQGYCAITGVIERTIDFDGNPFTSKGQKDIFVARLGVVPQEVTGHYEFKTPGWYLVSLPVTPANKSVSALFPTAVNAYRYDSASRSYQAVSMMDPQNGYWLLFNKASSAAISGLPVTDFTQNYPAGWHLIGAVAGTTNFSNPADVPDGAVLAVLGWQTVGEQYVPIYPTGAQKLDEKQGYWLAALQDCQLSLPGESGLNKNNSASVQDYENFAKTFGAEPPPPPFLTGVSDGLLRPVQELTSRHFPNPFNPIITIEYLLPENGNTSILIYNNLGQMVRELVRDYQNAGKHQIVWDARNEAGEEVANGIYLYQIIHGGNSVNRKIMLLR